MLASQNPFRRSRISKIRYQISQTHFQYLIDRVKRMNYACVIRGPHGTGKSTLLEDVQRALMQSGQDTQHHRIHHCISRAEKSLLIKTILDSGRDTIFFLDGGENLGFATWAWLAFEVKRRACRLIATTHRVSFLPTCHKTEVDKHLMLELTSTLAEDHWNIQLEHLAVQTYRRYKGNMREVFRACYLALALEPDDRFSSHYKY